MAALALWLVLSAWGFAGDGYTDWLLAVVSGFIFIVVALLFVLSQVAKRPRSIDKPDPIGELQRFHDWRAGDFDIWQDRVKGTNATIEVLLPLAAVAFGMTAFAIAFHIAGHGAL
jgi:hypothetical protein